MANSRSDQIINHPTLDCSLRGKASQTSIQFRNLKYASIPARFKDSVPNNQLRAGEDGVFDATKFGPSCPQRRGAQAFDLTVIGDVKLPCEEGQGDTERMDEFECLHVNVTVPKATLKTESGSGKNLPVFVWIHGGGLSLGSNSWPQYDVQRFVDRSIEIVRPVIGVAVNYRVGLWGFVASRELGASGNMGFKDQVLAFRWIKKHIAGFGGDPNNVTAVGESAGGISLSTLLCANIGSEGLFERVIIMSGDTTLRKPRKTSWHEKMYAQQATHLGISTSELKAKLLDTDANELAQQLPFAAHYCGHIDGSFLACDPTLSILADGTSPVHKPSWCKRFVIGDTRHDGTILKSRILDHPDVINRLKSSCAKFFSEEQTSLLLSTYQLEHNLPEGEEKEMLLTLVTELRFYLPAVLAHRGWLSTSPPKSAHRYHFHAINPFKGAYQMLSSHELDVAFLLQNYNAYLEGDNLRVAIDMSDNFVGYVGGHEWCKEGEVLVFGSGKVKGEKQGEYDGWSKEEVEEGGWRGWRCARARVLEEIGVDKCWQMVEDWQGVASED